MCTRDRPRAGNLYRGNVRLRSREPAAAVSSRQTRSNVSHLCSFQPFRTNSTLPTLKLTGDWRVKFAGLEKEAFTYVSRKYSVNLGNFCEKLFLRVNSYGTRIWNAIRRSSMLKLTGDWYVKFMGLDKKTVNKCRSVLSFQWNIKTQNNSTFIKNRKFTIEIKFVNLNENFEYSDSGDSSQLNVQKGEFLKMKKICRKWKWEQIYNIRRVQFSSIRFSL